MGIFITGSDSINQIDGARYVIGRLRDAYNGLDYRQAIQRLNSHGISIVGDLTVPDPNPDPALYIPPQETIH